MPDGTQQSRAGTSMRTDMKKCPRCGKLMPNEMMKCMKCGFVFAPAGEEVVSAASGVDKESDEGLPIRKPKKPGEEEKSNQTEEEAAREEDRGVEEKPEKGKEPETPEGGMPELEEEAGKGAKAGLEKGAKGAVEKKAAGAEIEKGAEAGLRKGAKIAGKEILGAGAKTAVTTGGRALAAGAASTGPPGWLILALIILLPFIILIVIILILMLVGIIMWFFHKGPISLKMPVNYNVPEYKQVLEEYKKYASEIDPKTGKPRLEIADPLDREFIEKGHPEIGQIDIRLLKTLVYLASKFEHIKVSHIISEYINMPGTEDNSDFIKAVISRQIWAHKQGQAADITEINSVNKYCVCQSPPPEGCGCEYIPVQVAWQDPVPEVPASIINPMCDFTSQSGPCCKDCYQPTAQANVHNLIKALLEMPAALNDQENMFVRQLITYSYERDVKPFETGAEKPTLDEVYGEEHYPQFPNYGLFALPDYPYMVDHVHIGF